MLVLLIAPNMVSATRHAGGVLSRSVALALGLFFVLWLASACQTSCGPGDQAPIPYVDGKTSIEGFNRIYETTPRDGEWLHYPSNRRFSFQHDLGTTNYQIYAYIAFGSHPVPKDQDASADIVAPSGDIFVIERQTANTLLVRNNTCSDQYLYVKLVASVAGSTAVVSGDAGP